MDIRRIYSHLKEPLSHPVAFVITNAAGGLPASITASYADSFITVVGVLLGSYAIAVTAYCIYLDNKSRKTTNQHE